MSHDLYTYGGQDRIYFKLTLNGVGVNPSLATNDVILSKDGASGGSVVDITADCTPVDATYVPGVFYWTPDLASRTQCEVMIISIKDFDYGGDFDEDCLIIATGGHASARFSG